MKKQLQLPFWQLQNNFRVIHTKQFDISKFFCTKRKLESSDLILNLLQRDFKTFKIQYPTSNVTESVADKLKRRLHLLPNHPLNILKTRSS